MARVVRSRRGSSLVVSPGARRETLWLGKTFVTGTTGTALAAGSFVIDASFNAGALALAPFTIVRTIGEISVMSDQIAAFEVPQGAMGMQIVTDKALALGATAIEDPVTEVSSD